MIKQGIIQGHPTNGPSPFVIECSKCPKVRWIHQSDINKIILPTIFFLSNDFHILQTSATNKIMKIQYKI